MNTKIYKIGKMRQQLYTVGNEFDRKNLQRKFRCSKRKQRKSPTKIMDSTKRYNSVKRRVWIVEKDDERRKRKTVAEEDDE
ncbi:hypothetical protein IC582_028802 [Cucumis melo]